MTQRDYAHLALVVDRSGSMWGIKDDMNGAIKSLLEEQAALPGTLRVDVTLFDNVLEYPFTDVEAGDIDATDLIKPRAGTALLDAVGETVVRLGARLDKLPEDERPGKVIVAVVTDGEENQSRDWTYETVKELVKEQEEKYSWEFIFLGANIDSKTVGARFGFNQTADYMATSAGAIHAGTITSGYLTRSRMYESVNLAELDTDALKA